jgi:hypothetical protein
MAREVSISFQFVAPADRVLEAARQMAASSDQDERLVGQAVVELTGITNRMMAAVSDTASKENYDLAIYFDYKFGDSLQAAKRPRWSEDGIRCGHGREPRPLRLLGHRIDMD